jgi:DNA polymerase III subunit beta
MKIESIREKLSDAVSKAEKIAGKNPTLPVLAGLYLKAEKGNLLIRSTNLDLGISINIPVKVIEDGETVVPAQILNSFLSSITEDKNITLELVDNTLKVETKSARTTLKTLPVEEFPLVPELTDDLAFSMPAKDLAQGIKSVVYAASVGSMKPELASVFITYRDGELVFVATDSFRLAEKKVKVKKIPHFKNLLIPQKNAQEIVRLLDRDNDDVSVTIGENQAAFHKEGMYLATRIVDGNFPDYRQIIPNESKTKAILLKEDLQTALKTNLIFADNFNQLTLTISPKNKLFEITSKNSNVGENVSKIDSAIEGDDLTISINHRYLVDCFSSIPTDSVSLSFNGSNKAVLVQGVGDKSFLYLVMPMNR